MRLVLDAEGPGSYESILEYVEAVLRENTYVAHEVYGEVQSRERLARGMLYSILHRLEVTRTATEDH
jgi:hypothetical protein